MSYLQVLIELTVGYLALFMLVKWLGKTQISQITTFDFISALVLGDIVGGAIFDGDVGLLKLLLAIGLWGLLIFITEIITQKFRKLRYILEGKPAIIINQGRLDWNEMKKNHLDINQLQQLLRSKDIFSLQGVEYAILENDGSISVLQKANAGEQKKTLPLTIISDGEVILKNLQKAGLNKDWLYQQLNTHGISQPAEISYAEWQPGKNLFIQKYWP